MRSLIRHLLGWGVLLNDLARFLLKLDFTKNYTDGLRRRLQFGQARSVCQWDRGRNTGLGTMYRQWYWSLQLFWKKVLLLLCANKETGSESVTMWPIHPHLLIVKVSWILNPGPLLAPTCHYDISVQKRGLGARKQTFRTRMGTRSFWWRCRVV